MVQVYDDKYRELLSGALDELRGKTDYTQLTPGGKARALLEICMRELGNAYGTFSLDLLQAFVRYATGENLDLIGELMGVARLEATRNTVESATQVQKFYVESGTFGDINNSVQFTIPSGTEITTRTTNTDQEVVKYTLTADAVCATAATVVYVSVRAVEFGEVSNVGAGNLVVHNYTLYDDYLNDTLKTTNIEGIAHARERESDDNYRYRIINQTLNSELANSVAVRVAALEVPGVADVVLEEFRRGIGTGAVYIKSVAPPASEYLLAMVDDNIARIKAFGNFVEARRPNLVGIEMVVKLNLYKAMPTLEEEDLKKRVRDRIHEYVNGLDINESLEVDLLVNQIKAVDSNIRSTGIPSRQIDNLYVWKYSAAEDSRVRREALAGYTARNFDRVLIEFEPLEDNADPITVRV